MQQTTLSTSQTKGSKRLTFLTFLFLTLLFAGFTNNVKAQLGGTCASSISLTEGSPVNDSLPADSIRWYSFVASSTSITIREILSNNSIGHIHFMRLFAVCGGSFIATDSITSTNDSLLIITDSTLTEGQTYFLALSNNELGCIRCAKGTAIYNMVIKAGDSQPCYTLILDGAWCPSNPAYCVGLEQDQLSPECVNGTVCVGSPVTFSVSQLGTTNPSNITFFRIQNNAGPVTVFHEQYFLFVANSNSYTYTFTSPGTYTMGLYNSSGYIAGLAGTVTVAPVPTPSFTISPTGPVCPAEEVTLTRTDNPAPDFWDWQVDEFLVLYPLPPSNISPLIGTACSLFGAGGTHTITLNETNGGNLNVFWPDHTLGVNTGCVASVTKTITVNPLNPTFTDSYNKCAGGNTTVTFTNTTTSCPDPSDPSSDWTWNFGDGNTYTGPNPPTHVYTPGIYTVTLTANDNPSCSDQVTYSQTITIYPPVNISITGQVDLACMLIDSANAEYPTTNNTFNVAVTGGSGKYINGIWIVTGGTASPTTGTSTNVTLSNDAIGGTIYYTITDAETGCTYTDSLVIRGCCYCSSDALYDPDMSYIAAHLSSYFSPSELANNVSVISGTLVFKNWTTTHPLIINGLAKVDMPVFIYKSEVKLGTNAQMDVTSGNTLAVRGSYLHACNSCYPTNAWEGIYIEGGGTLSMNLSLEEDAKMAVNSINGGNYKIFQGTALNKDYIGINVGPYSGNHTGYITDSKISCNTSGWTAGIAPTILPTPATLIAPYTGLRTSAGIKINSVQNISIGAAGSPNANDFANMDYGIITTASNVTVLNNTFFDNTPYSAAMGTDAIYARGDASSLKTITIGTTAANTSNSFNNWTRGVALQDTINATIQGNTFNKNIIGVNLMNTFRDNIAIISNNILHVYQIGVNAYNNLHSHVDIRDNTMLSSSNLFTRGVELNEFSPTNGIYLVYSNSITNFGNGVYANNLYGGDVTTNTILLNNNHISGNNEGVYLGGSNRSNVNNNTIFTLGFGSNVQDGIYINMGSGNNTVACNSTTRTNNGIAFAGPTVSTNFVENTMSLNKNGLLLHPSAFIGNQGVAGNPNDNQWIFCSPWATYTQSPTPVINLFVRNLPSSPYWPSNNNGGGITFVPTPGTSCYNCATNTSSCGVGGGKVSTFAALQAIGNATFFNTFPVASHWLEKHSLYKYLTEVDSSLLSNSTVKNFRDSVKIANMGALDEVAKTMADTNGLSTADITTATNLNASIITTDTVEQTTQTVNKIIIAMQSAGSNLPNNVQISTLQGIAPLCPSEYGNAVFVARALLSQVDSTVYTSACELSSVTNNHNEIRNAENKDSLVSFGVYPNPANTLLHVYLNLAPKSRAFIEVFNEANVRVEASELEQETTLSVSNLPSGIYFYRIVDINKHIIANGKISIVH